MFIGRSGNSVVLKFSKIPGTRGLEVVYKGGVATTASISTYTLASIIGSFAVNEFIEGLTSGAFGIIKTFNTVSKVMTVDVLYGTFIAGETLNKRTTEDAGLSSGVSATLSSVDVKSFVEVYPEVAQAVDIQTRYNVKTKDDFENKTVTKDMVSRRDTAKVIDTKGSNIYSDLQPETRSLINKFRRHVFY